MTRTLHSRSTSIPGDADRALATRLRAAVEGEVLFDRASRGRYCDRRLDLPGRAGRRAGAENAGRRRAPRSTSAASCGVPLLPRGAGSSQCGQTVGAALVIDHSKHLNAGGRLRPRAHDGHGRAGRRARRSSTRGCEPHGLWFPVDVSTSAQATLGGMAGNNSCGSRSIAYGNMVHNVLAIDALLADGTEARSAPRRRWPTRSPRIARAARRAARDRRARARRDRARCPEGAAPRRRLQHRRLQSAERAAVHSRRQRQLRASAGRQRRHARVDARAHAQARAAAAHRTLGVGQLPDAVPGDGMHAAHRQARAVRGRARRPHDDRPRARQSGVSRRSIDARAASASRRRSCWSSSAATIRDERARLDDSSS